MKKTTALIIMDGWGVNNGDYGNAVHAAKTPNYDRYLQEYPHTVLNASGLAVGLPEGQMGNSEVGHLNIGAGRVIYQPLTAITKDIKDGVFFENEVLIGAIAHAKEKGKKLHLLGLVSDGGVHSHIDHIKGLLELAKKHDFEDVYLHAFMDGRDTPPTSGKGYLEEIEGSMKSIGLGQVATVSGRFYAMDRDNRWERIEKAYQAMVHGKGQEAASATEAMEVSYEAEVTDEFVKPTVIVKDGAPLAKIEEDDALIFFNFRPDRGREMTTVLTDPSFSAFDHDYFSLKYITMTQYDEKFEHVEIAYPPKTVNNTLGAYLSGLGKKQLRIAETEKYAHVTFFFNGGVEEPNEGEERILVPSPKVETYDMQPEMSAIEVTDKLIAEIEDEKHDLIILNFANADMVGHTGDFDAAVKAVETVDQQLGRVIDALLQKGGKAIVTADHGNAENMMEKGTGAPITKHTTNVVPCLVIGQGEVSLREGGQLSDLAPTLLYMMDLAVPSEMTGKNIIETEA